MKRFEVLWQARTDRGGFYSGSKIILAGDSDYASLLVKQYIRQHIFEDTFYSSIKITSVREVL